MSLEKRLESVYKVIDSDNFGFVYPEEIISFGTIQNVYFIGEFMGFKWKETDLEDIITVDEKSKNKIIHKFDTLAFLNEKLSNTQHIFLYLLIFVIP